MDTRVLALGLASALTASLALGQHSHAFLEDAIAGDLAEIALGKLALERAQSQEVRDYGRKVVADHQSALVKAKEAAEEAGVTPPRAPVADAQQIHHRLSQLSGAEFDREFTAHMITDHEKHVAAFRAQAAQPESEATRHARETLPRLEEHLEIAERIGSDAVRR